jgi:hypothetical protein
MEEVTTSKYYSYLFFYPVYSLEKIFVIKKIIKRHKKVVVE